VKQPETFDEQGLLRVIVETPQGSRNKLAWNEKHEMYELKGVLPQVWRFRSTSAFCLTPRAKMAIPGHSGFDG
jgi:hypothetical protein